MADPRITRHPTSEKQPETIANKNNTPSGQRHFDATQIAFRGPIGERRQELERQGQTKREQTTIPAKERTVYTSKRPESTFTPRSER